MRHPITLRLAGLATSLALAAGFATGSVAAAQPAGGALVDSSATPETRSLFAYLEGVQGRGVLFGHQHSNTDGATVTDPTALTQSDVKASVGDYPAMFGWDGLALDGDEKPGLTTNSRRQNARLLAKAFVASDKLGGINTLSMHMPNFLTGGRYTDTSGDVVSAILPGGAKNAEYRNYLNAVALAAQSARRADGTLVPIIIRPLHENNGGWFWWGAGHTSSAAYINLYRYTVEYLRDTLGVRNFLYAYSPGLTFGGDPTNYLKTYPGDEYVDILGYDSYDDGADVDSPYVSNLVKDLGMITDLADARGKIAALTEFGPSPTFKPSGNADTHWFTDLLAAIKADAKAKRIAYMLTWANWSADGVYVPYPATGSLPDHPLLPDFRSFAADPYTYFAGDLRHVYDQRTRTAKASPVLRLVTPWDRQRVTDKVVKVRVRLIGRVQSAVIFNVDGGPQLVLRPDRAGFWSGTWRIDARWLDNRAVTVTTKAKVDGRWLTDSAKVLLGEKPALGQGWVEDFETYAGDDQTMLTDYALINGAELALTTEHKSSGSYGGAYSYDFSSASYAGIGKGLTADWSSFSTMSMWLQGDGSSNGVTLQIVADGVYFEYNTSLADTTGTVIEAPFSEFKPAPWDSANQGKTLDAAHLAKVTGFNLYTGQGGGPTTGTFYIDDLRAT